MSIILGFYLGHDSNVALSVDGQVRYRKSERHSGLKHHKADFGFVIKTLRDWGFSLGDVDICAYTDGNRNNLGVCGEGELFCTGKIDGVKSFCIDHHYAHILSGWPVVDTELLKFGVCIDGRGDHKKSTTVVKNPSSPKVVYEEFGLKMGWEFYQIGRLLGFKGLEYDFAGKLMGLQSYPESELASFGLKRMVDLDTSSLYSRQEGGSYKSFSEWHDYWFARTKKIFDSLFQTPDFVSYSGGCAQNTVYNHKLLNLFPNLFIPPHCYDGGLSLGCIEFVRLYLGHEKFSKKGFPYWQDDYIGEEPTSTTLKKAARMLADGKIIGWAQGRGELGPRALGNRSILMNATKAGNKETLNKKIKKREPWRPYAGSILSSHSSEYFDLKESKYMLYACQVLNKSIPAITHVDGSCRMQTVSDCENPVFHALLDEYFRLTGMPVLLNTSLNTMGNPIASSRIQVKDLLKSNLDAVFIGDKIYRNKFF
jgi:carbamoyltransferase